MSFKFRGEVLQMLQEETYIGMVIHAMKEMTFSAEQRAVANE